MKIRNKLTYQFTLIVASILLIFSLAIYFFSAAYRQNEFNKRLITKGLTTARLFIKVDEVDEKLLRIIDRNNLTALQNEKITIYDSVYTKLYSSNDYSEVPVSPILFNEISQKKELFFNYMENEAAGILYTEKNKKFFIIVSANDHFGINKLKNLQLVLITGFFISMGAVFIGGWLFSGQALTPILKIIYQVKDISASNLHARVEEGNGQDEIAQLAIQFNQMLERLEKSFESQKSFVSNSSHELRTPLSTIRTQLEISLAASRNKEEYIDTLQSVLDDINNLISLTNGLLDLAQVNSDVSKSGVKKIRLDELIYQTISDLSKKYPSQKILFNVEDSIEEDQMFIVSGNETLLKTAFVNIIDNACKFSVGKPVNISIKHSKNTILVSVKDKGVGIRQAELSHIFDPFYRGNNARTINGHGIGLSLSKKIVELHDGNIEAFSKVNEGTNILITFSQAH